MESSDHPKPGGQKPLNHGKVFDNQSLNDSLTSLYTPPYSSSAQNYFNRKREEQAPPVQQKPSNNFDLNHSLSQPSDYAKKMQAMSGNKPFESERREFHYVPQPPPPMETILPKEQVVHDVSEKKNGLMAILALSVGANLAVLGLLQLLFAQNGKLSLEWDAHYWFLYVVPALPLLFLGYRKLKSFRDT